MKQHNRFIFYVDYMPNKNLTCAPDCAFILQITPRNSYELAYNRIMQLE